MSSYLRDLTNPKTGKTQKAWCIDDYFGQHRYGYFFRRDGKDADFKDFDELQADIKNFKIYNEDDVERQYDI